MPDLIQPSFARGEISETLQGRIDLSLYAVGLSTALNVVIHAEGGASKRPSTLYLAPVKDHSYSPRLIQFRFKNGDEYQLEFGDMYLRFVRADEHVTEDPINITGVSQANPCVITVGAHTYANGDEIFVTGIVGMEELNSRRFIVQNVTGTTMQLTGQVTGNDIDSTGYGAYVSGGTTAKIYELATPYELADLPELKFSQTLDVMKFTHRKYPTQELVRLGNNNWTIGDAVFGTGTARPNGIDITVDAPGSATVAYTVTATDRDTGEESVAGLWSNVQNITGISQSNPAVVTTAGAHNFETGDNVHIFGNLVGMDELFERDFKITQLSPTTFSLNEEDSTNYTPYSSGGNAGLMLVRTTTSAEPTDNTVTWAAVTNASRYSIYRESNGIFGLIGETELLEFKDDGKVIDLTISPPSTRLPFRLEDDYPGAIGKYEQRQVYGGSNNLPDTSFFSQVGNFNNLNISTPLQDDDAITSTLNSDTLVEIRHYLTGQDLLVFGGSSEHRINSGGDAAFTPSTINQKKQTLWGCSHLRPLSIGNSVLFVTDDLQSIRDFEYSLQLDGYQGGYLSIFAKHLLDRFELKDWSMIRSPDPRIHMVRNDGRVITLTYQQDQQVIAFTQWSTQGFFEGTTSSGRPTMAANREETYFVVQRNIGGNTVRYIERTQPLDFDTVEEARRLDCSISFDNPITITNVTTTSPIVVTAPTHGLADGDQVRLFEIVWEPIRDDDGNETQPDQLNRNRYYVANATADTFELVTSKGNPIDGTSFNAYARGGVVRKCVSEVSGLWHLEGATISALADGAVIEELTVSDGKVTLPFVASLIHFGFNYVADIETLDLTRAQVPLVEGEEKNITYVALKLYRSRGVTIGPSGSSMKEIKDKEPDDTNRVSDIFDAVRRESLPESWNIQGRMLVRQKHPLPMTLLYLAPDVDLNREY